MLLEIRDVSKVFADEDRGSNITVLKDISLSVDKKEFVCLLGPVGCGKTTLLHMIAGFEKPTTGKILLKDEEIEEPSPQRGVVFQEFSLFPWMTVIENVTFGLRVQGFTRARRREIAEKYLSLVGLEGFRDARIHELSAGMKQKVAIARTLALDPDILLMDEPFSNMDEQTREDLDGELLRIWKDEMKTVVFVTHNIEEAVLLGDRIVVLTQRPGQIRADMPVDLSRPRRLYSEETSKVRRDLRALFH